MEKIRSGVYALKHKATGLLYVGSSSDLATRHAKWRGNLNRGKRLPPRIQAFAPTTADDWEFIVLRDCTGFDHDALVAEERAAFDALLRKAPGRMLNAIVPSTGGGRGRGGAPARVVVYDGDRVMTQAEAAAALGCLTKTLAKRLVRFREEGVVPHVQLDYLKKLSAEHRINC